MEQDIGGERISLSTTSCAYQPCYIGKNLNIGDNVSIGSMCHIGRNVTIGNHANIQGSTYIADRTVLGSHVFIGPNSTILNDKYPPSGDASNRSVLGGGSVLTKPIPTGEVWAGNPATFLMTREEYDARGE